MLKIKYSDPPEVEETADGFCVKTSCDYVCDAAELEQLVNVVTRFLNNGEDVEVQIKHKEPKE